MLTTITGGKPFWPEKDGLPESYTELRESMDTDILILGSGITGALVARSFARAGHRVTVIDKRRIACGSTSASTAMLQYEIDVPLTELITQIGKQKAERAYLACAEAIHATKRIANEYPDACNFKYKPSIYLAAKRGDVKFLKEEYEARKAAGLDVRFLDKKTLAEMKIKAHAAIYSELGAEMDPYLLAHNILKELKEQGHRIYERTEIDIASIDTKDGIRAKTKTGFHVQAQKIIFATGYESAEILKENIVTLKSSYALVTEKMHEDPADASALGVLVWDTAKPYLYARSTNDGRILIGGGDIGPKNMFLRDLLIRRKSKKLLKKFLSYVKVPHIQKEARIAYAWSGTFGETKDGLAYIGESPEWENAYFALGFGGNGILFSVMAADLLEKLYRGEISPDLDLFRFRRS